MVVADQGGAALLDKPEALRDFYETSFPRVYSYFFQRSGGVTSVAEDLTQETFLAAAGEIKKGTVPANQLAWLLGIARHHLLDHYRAKEREERKLSLAWEMERAADSQLEASSLTRERSHAALHAVPAPQRTVLSLHYLDGLPVAEVARLIGRSVHATESLLARGRESFRRAYREADDE
jgi:RNA polymerase sigma-70 factor (ECF subfamily)